MGSLTVLKNETRGMIGKSVLFDADSISKKGGVWIKFVVLAVFFPPCCLFQFHLTQPRQ